MLSRRGLLLFHLRRSALQRQLHSDLLLSPRVAKARRESRPIVALESTVITHGLPFPTNLETAQLLERAVREGGAEPATIALLDGKIRVGLSEEELEAVAKEGNAVKVSRRDIAHALVTRRTGGTTVAATMWAAAGAGIRVFATGGIGGVHRGAEETFDISADLSELEKTPVAVVCAGIKSILDIGKTIEVLETNGVNCIVFGKENVFPGFFSSRTSFKAQLCSSSIDEIATIIEKSRQLGLPAGTIVAVPIAKEFEAEGEVVEEAIQEALKEAEAEGIRSQAITPFILARVAKKTRGMSMKTNVALLEANARVAARLAVSLSSLSSSKSPVRTPPPSFSSPSSSSPHPPTVLCIGATIIDLEAITDEDIKDDGGTYSGCLVQRPGGVGRNHAEALARLGCRARLLSVVGRDAHLYQPTLHSHNPPLLDTSLVATLDDVTTAFYLSINHRGSVKYGISAISHISSRITTQMIDENEEAVATADFVVVDGNIPQESISRIFQLAHSNKTKVWFDPTDQSKGVKWLNSSLPSAVSVVSPNAKEFVQILLQCGSSVPESALSSVASLRAWLSAALPRLSALHSLDLLLVTLAEAGSLLISNPGSPSPSFIHLPPPRPPRIVSVSGAGDSLNAGILAAFLHGESLEKAAEIGNAAASLTLSCQHAVSPLLSHSLPQHLRERVPC